MVGMKKTSIDGKENGSNRGGPHSVSETRNCVRCTSACWLAVGVRWKEKRGLAFRKIPCYTDLQLLPLCP
jgi:hypothetical protein